MNDEQLNAHGLYIHAGARAAIRDSVAAGRTGSYPVYLVGFALPEMGMSLNAG